ncbi:uncharacterized protein LOC143180121 [Calliopsis andreniformis]|uniref:uncharacterized protein LOC143180121 n=1 Tax=Calliopsis andreniformis TaxID=337506 RepID=UPI003FCE7085
MEKNTKTFCLHMNNVKILQLLCMSQPNPKLVQTLLCKRSIAFPCQNTFFCAIFRLLLPESLSLQVASPGPTRLNETDSTKEEGQPSRGMEKGKEEGEGREKTRNWDSYFDHTFRRCRGKDRTWPILYTNFLLRCLVDSVAVFTRDSLSITSLSLDGIPLPPKYINILCSGLRTNWRLTHLSLAKCRIGDVGCNLLLECLRNNPNLRVLNLSSCRLTNRSGMGLSLFLKRRKADLLQNIWEESSLQSREEHIDKKPQGLHTLVLNQNPKFGDNGIRQLTFALKSDMWVKSLNVKRCGITKHGAEAIIELLRLNNVIMHIDFTANHIPINILQGILRSLKRRREMAESMSMKKRFLLNWRDGSLRKMFKGNRMRKHIRVSRSLKKRVNECSLQIRRLKKTQGLKEIRFKETEDTQKTKKVDSFKKKSLRDLESELLNVINSNSKLKEELWSNKVSLDAEVQERSRTENELQKVWDQLNNLRSKVIMLNCLTSKVCSESQLLKGLRDVFEKFEAFASKSTSDVEASEEEPAIRDAKSEMLPLK